MVWDLGRAMARKGEFESARLDDFEFRLRVRAMRMFAGRLALEPDDLVRELARHPVDGILAGLVASHGGAVAQAWADCLADARAALVRERGDPAPYRLA